MKYIMFESPHKGVLPIVFPEHIEHSFIFNSINNYNPGIIAISAGRCDKDGKVYGKSVSLNLVSKQEDAAILSALLFNF